VFRRAYTNPAFDPELTARQPIVFFEEFNLSIVNAMRTTSWPRTDSLENNVRATREAGHLRRATRRHKMGVLTPMVRQTRTLVLNAKQCPLRRDHSPRGQGTKNVVTAAIGQLRVQDGDEALTLAETGAMKSLHDHR